MRERLGTPQKCLLPRNHHTEGCWWSLCTSCPWLRVRPEHLHSEMSSRESDAGHWLGREALRCPCAGSDGVPQDPPGLLPRVRGGRTRSRMKSARLHTWLRTGSSAVSLHNLYKMQHACCRQFASKGCKAPRHSASSHPRHLDTFPPVHLTRAGSVPFS